MPTYSTKELSSYAAVKRNRLHPLFKIFYSIKKRPNSSVKKLIKQKSKITIKKIDECRESQAFHLENNYENTDTNKKNSIFQLYKWRETFFAHRDPFFDYPVPIYQHYNDKENNKYLNFLKNQ